MTPVELIQYDYLQLVENILFPIADVPTAYTSEKSESQDWNLFEPSRVESCHKTSAKHIVKIPFNKIENASNFYKLKVQASYKQVFYLPTFLIERIILALTSFCNTRKYCTYLYKLPIWTSSE